MLILHLLTKFEPENSLINQSTAINFSWRVAWVLLRLKPKHLCDIFSPFRSTLGTAGKGASSFPSITHTHLQFISNDLKCRARWQTSSMTFSNFEKKIKNLLPGNAHFIELLFNISIHPSKCTHKRTATLYVPQTLPACSAVRSLGDSNM